MLTYTNLIAHSSSQFDDRVTNLNLPINSGSITSFHNITYLKKKHQYFLFEYINYFGD